MARFCGAKRINAGSGRRCVEHSAHARMHRCMRGRFIALSMELAPSRAHHARCGRHRASSLSSPPAVVRHWTASLHRAPSSSPVQDISFSRIEQGFESPWGHFETASSVLGAVSFLRCVVSWSKAWSKAWTKASTKASTASLNRSIERAECCDVPRCASMCAQRYLAFVFTLGLRILLGVVIVLALTQFVLRQRVRRLIAQEHARPARNKAEAPIERPRESCVEPAHALAKLRAAADSAAKQAVDANDG